MTTELLRLAELCEQASGPDRELDLAIARASYDHGFPIFGELVNYDPVLWLERYGPITASLDAAMTLVPEALAWWVQDYRGDGCNAIVGKLGSDARGNFLEFCHCSRECKTPALALCAAALRARSQESNHG